MGGPEVDPKPNKQRSARGRASGLSYAPGVVSSPGSPRSDWSEVGRFVRRYFKSPTPLGEMKSAPPARVFGTRPSGGSIKRDARLWPSTFVNVEPGSSQPLLYPPTL